MPKLSDYTFGSVMVGGEKITSDLIILPDGSIQTDWWRISGHHLVLDDLHGLLDTQPAVFVIGTGANGRMTVHEEVLSECRRRGIEVHARPTAEAVDEYNRIQSHDLSVLACFHLTC